MIKSHQEQLRQLLTATSDGDLISKDARDYLVTCGYAQRRAGWNIATPWGVEVAANLKLTATNTGAMKRVNPFIAAISVTADRINFGDMVFISHERILDGLPETSIIRRAYNNWLAVTLKAQQ